MYRKPLNKHKPQHNTAQVVTAKHAPSAQRNNSVLGCCFKEFTTPSLRLLTACRNASFWGCVRRYQVYFHEHTLIETMQSTLLFTGNTHPCSSKMCCKGSACCNRTKGLNIFGVLIPHSLLKNSCHLGGVSRLQQKVYHLIVSRHTTADTTFCMGPFSMP